jgi:hypothetical protein
MTQPGEVADIAMEWGERFVPAAGFAYLNIARC